ncbi:MAG: PilZ protein [Xanthobacteraceae bacterium]|nr:PilZ protein [Xanthobacteraceae bacterium]
MSFISIRPEPLQDVVEVQPDRRPDVQIITSLAGRYMLGSKRDAQGNRREFACRALNMSPQIMLLAAPVVAPVGERVIAHLDQFGKLEGVITRLLERGFIMNLSGSEEEQAKRAAKLIWLENHKNHDVNDVRKHGRIVPRNPYSTLVLPDGQTMTCLVIDMSVSGAAVSADIMPEIGMPLALGKVVGRVRRQFAEGFAIQFVETQDLETMEERLIRQ